MKKSFKSKVILVVVFSILVNLFIGFGAFAATEITYLPLQEIGEIDNIDWDFMVSYTYKYVPVEITEKYSYQVNSKWIWLQDVMSFDDLEYILDMLSDDNLEYVGTEDGEIKNMPDIFHLCFVQNNPESTNWHIYFDENRVLFDQVYIDPSTGDLSKGIIKQGWFEYKNRETYQKLYDFLNNLADKYYQKEEEHWKSLGDNQVEVSDIEILYYGHTPFLDIADGFTWVVISYKKNGKTEIAPALAPNYNAEKLEDKQTVVYWLCEDFEKNNTLYFSKNGGRIIRSYNGGKTGYEYDNEYKNATIDFKMQFNVTDAGKVSAVTGTTIPLGQGMSALSKTVQIDMNGYVQRGTLPNSGKFAFLPENNVEYNTEESTKKNDADEKPQQETTAENQTEDSSKETADKNENVTENKAENTSEKKETADKNEDMTDNKAENTSDKKETETIDKQKQEVENSETDDTKTEVIEEKETESYTDYAKNLMELGLFKGTDNGYELKSTFTRAQSTAMLVRLLGKESEALAMTPTGIFADVPADNWAAPYVEYCYVSGITKGTGNNAFSPNEAISGDQYITLVIRALGYKDAEPEAAEIMSEQIGLLEKESLSIARLSKLYRDEMVYISYRALSVNVLNGAPLIEKLIKENAVDEEMARKQQLIK